MKRKFYSVFLKSFFRGYGSESGSPPPGSATQPHTLGYRSYRDMDILGVPYIVLYFTYMSALRKMDTTYGTHPSGLRLSRNESDLKSY